MKAPLLLLALCVAVAPPSRAQERALHIYGYFDLEYEIGNRTPAAKRGTFDQHHFNVITSVVLDERFRVMGEIEWEHGPEIDGGDGIGEVKLERAWLEYHRSDAFNVRVGKFLTPYGLYNLIHDATPTFLSTFLPLAVYGKYQNPMNGSQRLYLKFATGVQVLGTLFTEGGRLEYAAYLANGEGIDPHKQDDNPNKALGGRLLYAPVLPWDLALGTSFVTQENGNAADTRQTTWAVDLTSHWGAAALTAEASWSWLEGLDAVNAPSGEFSLVSSYYGQAAYTLAERYTPFFRYEVLDNLGGGGLEYHYITGLNIAVTPRVYLKAEAHVVDDQRAGERYEMFVSSVAVAF